MSLCDPMDCSMLGFLSITSSWSLLKLMSIESVMPSNHLILCHPLLLLPSIFLSIRIFCNELVLRIRWPKYWSFSFSPSNEYSGLISFQIVGLISLQSKGSSRVFSNTVVQKHQFFSSQLSLQFNSHIHTWLLEKNIALTRWTFLGRVMSLLFNMLSRLDISFLPRSKHLLISWLQSPSAVILDPPKIKSIIVSTSPHFYLPWSDGTRCHDVSFFNVEFQASIFIILFHHHPYALVSLHFLPLEWYHLHIWGCWCFS